MLAIDLVLEIRALLDAGELSQRAIATKLGVSRGVVGAIATGKRPLIGAVPQGDPWEGVSAALPTRCRGCGGMVYAPCRLCRVREGMARL